MKKLSIMLLIALLAFTVSACGGEDDVEVQTNHGEAMTLGQFVPENGEQTADQNGEENGEQMSGQSGEQYSNDLFWNGSHYEVYGYVDLDWEALDALMESLDRDLDRAWEAIEDRLEALTDPLWDQGQYDRVDALEAQFESLQDEIYERLDDLFERVETGLMSLGEFETNVREVIQRLRGFNFR